MTPRTFSATVDALRFGTLGDEATKALRELALACQDTGRKGSITLVLELKPGKGGQLEVFDNLKLSMPKPEKGSSLMFATPEGNLQRNDPRQQELPLKSVDTAPPADLKRVATSE